MEANTDTPIEQTEAMPKDEKPVGGQRQLEPVVSPQAKPQKTRYKYIHFVETEEVLNRRKVWDCKNNRTGSILSKIFYYKEWDEYCFTQAKQSVVFNDTCLMDTIDFINQMNRTLAG